MKKFEDYLKEDTKKLDEAVKLKDEKDFNDKFKDEITQNADEFVSSFLDFRGQSSKEFAKILKSF